MTNKEALKILENQRANQMQEIRNIETTMRQLFKQEQQLYGEQLHQVEIQEQRMLDEVVKELDALEQLDNQIEVLTTNNIMM